MMVYIELLIRQETKAKAIEWSKKDLIKALYRSLKIYDLVPLGSTIKVT